MIVHGQPLALQSVCDLHWRHSRNVVFRDVSKPRSIGRADLADVCNDGLFVAVAQNLTGPHLLDVWILRNSEQTLHADNATRLPMPSKILRNRHTENRGYRLKHLAGAWLVDVIWVDAPIPMACVALKAMPVAV